MDVSTAAGLLTVASSMDNRKVDPETAQVWAQALDGVDPIDAQTAVIRHYSVPGAKWMMPGDVIAGVRTIENERIAAAPDVYSLEPPKRITDLEGDDFDREYLLWIQETSRRIRRGEPIEVGPARVPLADSEDRMRELLSSLKAEKVS